jgi:hypothetical protein
MVRRIYHHRWGGWGSNPRPADYDRYGPVHRTHYLHGYHGAVPLVTLIAPFCTDDSVHGPVHSKAPDSSRPATVRNVARSAQPTAARANIQTPPGGMARLFCC